MKVYMITAKPDNEDSDAAWVVDAWDEWSMEQDYEGYERAIKRVGEECHECDIRVGIVEVPNNFLSSLYEIVSVKGEPCNE